MKPLCNCFCVRLPSLSTYICNLFLTHLKSEMKQSYPFLFQVAELIWWIFTFRPVSCHSQSCQQCSHHHQCHLRWEGAWDVLQTRGARARATCAEPPVPDLWWQQRQPQRQVLLLLLGSSRGNLYVLKQLWRLLLGNRGTVLTFTAIHFH